MLLKSVSLAIEMLNRIIAMQGRGLPKWYKALDVRCFNVQKEKGAIVTKLVYRKPDSELLFVGTKVNVYYDKDCICISVNETWLPDQYRSMLCGRNEYFECGTSEYNALKAKIDELNSVCPMRLTIS